MQASLFRTEFTAHAPVTAGAKPTPPASSFARRFAFPAAGDGQATRDAPRCSSSYEDYQSLFVSQRSETVEPVPLRVVEGSLPGDFPTGTYYLLGPGILADDHGSTVSPLDGHGYLRAFAFTGTTTVRYSAKYVATAAQREEKDQRTGRWRFTHRGPFSVLRGGRRLGNMKVMKDVANTSVVVWGGRLLCFWEGGVPHELHPVTLDTFGTFDVSRLAADTNNGSSGGGGGGGGHASAWNLGVDLAAQLLKPILHGVFKMPPKRILSHYKIDARRKRLLLLSCNAEDMLLPAANLTFYEFDDEFKLVHSKDFRVADHLMIHDWCFTDDHYIVVGNRVKLDVSGSLLAAVGVSPMISALTLNPGKPSTSPVYLLPRFSRPGGDVRDWRKAVEAPAQMWVIHMGNGFQERDAAGNTRIEFLASCCSYEWFSFHNAFGYNWRDCKLDPSHMNPTEEGKEALLPHLVKVSVTLDATGNERDVTVGGASWRWSRPAEFPAINQGFSGSKNRYTYADTTAAGSGRLYPHFPFDSVVKLDRRDGSAVAWSAGGRRFVGEPIFVPRGEAEDDGYVLVVEYAVSRKRCCLVIMDARKMGGPEALVAKLEVPEHLRFPLGFHGFWSPADRLQSCQQTCNI